MDVCSGTWGIDKAHDEVAYEGKTCPACGLLEEMRELRTELKQAIIDRNRFESEAAELEATLTERRTNIRAMIDEVQAEVDAKEGKV